jgi:16S rRNA (adenine1518-N6/adenine1519-N6)-dimethyltransferase
LPRPRKRFGQHFLTDPRALDRIVDALAPGAADTVIEIGPGRGALTDRLAQRAGRLVAIEIDRDLVRHLKERYAPLPSVTIVEGDALEADWSQLAGEEYLLAGNLPYYITTPLIFRVLASPRPRRAVLLVQREVASRLVAQPGTGDYGALSVNVQMTTQVTQVARVAAGAFHPRPAVDSAIVQLAPLASPLIAPADEDGFRRFVQAAFGMRRKQLLRVTRELWVGDAALAARAVEDAGLEPSIRPEAVAPDGFVRLYHVIARMR